MEKQILRERYIDKQALYGLLVNLFGNGGFEIEVRSFLELSRFLTKPPTDTAASGR